MRAINEDDIQKKIALNFIQKLINEYEEKENECNLLITDLENKNRILRRLGRSVDQRLTIIFEIKIAETKSDLCADAKKNLKSILELI